jgi:hypothetical protein
MKLLASDRFLLHHGGDFESSAPQTLSILSVIVLMDVPSVEDSRPAFRSALGNALAPHCGVLS